MATARSRISRRQMLRVGAGSLFIPVSLKAGKAPAQGGKKPFEGVTLNISCWSATYPKLIADYLPEFTERTGIKVNYDTPGFPVYNQRADLELSTGGSAYDVLNVTFIYSSCWIGAGWLTPLDEFIQDPNQTAADFDIEDFLPGLRKPETDQQGRLYGIPWTVDTYIAGARRATT
jgi:multiple sugar transport system substrate-binding protein